MIRVEGLEEALAEHGLRIAGSVVTDHSTDDRVFVPVAALKAVPGKEGVSKRAVLSAQRKLKELGIKAELLVRDEKSEKVESALRTSLTQAVPDLVGDVVLALEKRMGRVWLELKREMEAEDRRKLEQRLNVLSEAFDFERLELILDELLLPTKFELLTLIRQLAPVGLNSLVEHLKEANFDVPSPNWVNRRLDGLRRGGLIVRTHGELYALTANALQTLGTSFGRRSPDVLRALAISRRSV